MCVPPTQTTEINTIQIQSTRSAYASFQRCSNNCCSFSNVFRLAAYNSSIRCSNDDSISPP